MNVIVINLKTWKIVSEVFRYQFDERRARATNRSWMWTWVSGFFNKFFFFRGQIEKCELQLLDRPLVTCSIVCISIEILPRGRYWIYSLKTIREHERTRNHLHIRRRSQVRLIGVDIAQELVLKRFSNRFLPEKINRFKMSSAIRKLMSFLSLKSRTEITPSGLSSFADGFRIYCLTDLITWITAIITPN